MDQIPLVKSFIEQGIKLMQINEYLRSELVRAGFAGVDVQKTPLGVRITLRTSRPGLVIGKGGKRIQEITDVLQERFDLEMPQIEVEEVKDPDLNAQIMAERLAYSLDRGRHYRRAGYYILRKIMESGGALGAELRISGKVTSQRSRTQVFRAGTMTKSGQTAQDGVDKGVAQCIQKSGVLGIVVKIQHIDTKMGDEVYLKKDLLLKAQAEAEAQIAKTKAEYALEQEETGLSEEDKQIIDEVDEEAISEISLVPEVEGENEEKGEE
ncbi:MAG: 30S ribosomal protein S3 [Candidatus Lokiarchaeum sp. GC14_75]|nr:MAG: 30S ribosomal protein S3 [Candidatus Lokiarchaeum sp. GC14_75]